MSRVGVRMYEGQVRQQAGLTHAARLCCHSPGLLYRQRLPVRGQVAADATLRTMRRRVRPLCRCHVSCLQLSAGLQRGGRMATQAA